MAGRPTRRAGIEAKWARADMTMKRAEVTHILFQETTRALATGCAMIFGVAELGTRPFGAAKRCRSSKRRLGDLGLRCLASVPEEIDKEKQRT